MLKSLYLMKKWFYRCELLLGDVKKVYIQWKRSFTCVSYMLGDVKNVYIQWKSWFYWCELLLGDNLVLSVHSKCSIKVGKFKKIINMKVPPTG